MSLFYDNGKEFVKEKGVLLHVKNVTVIGSTIDNIERISIHQDAPKPFVYGVEKYILSIKTILEKQTCRMYYVRTHTIIEELFTEIIETPKNSLSTLHTSDKDVIVQAKEVILTKVKDL